MQWLNSVYAPHGINMIMESLGHIGAFKSTSLHMMSHNKYIMI